MLLARSKFFCLRKKLYRPITIKNPPVIKIASRNVDLEKMTTIKIVPSPPQAGKFWDICVSDSVF